MTADPRDIFGDDDQEGFPFQARLINENTIVVDAPTLDYSERGGDEEYIAETLNIADEDDKVVIEAFDNGTQSFEDLQVPNKMQYLIRFPKNQVCLNAEVLEVHTGQQNGILTMEGIPIQAYVANLNENPQTVTVENEMGAEEEQQVWIKNFCGRLAWRIADLNQSTRKARREKTKQKAQTKAATAFMKRMNLNG
jgi:hypothetical protein